MRITKYAQSCFLIELEGKAILIDPGKYCYSEKLKPEDFKGIDVLLLTHLHSDHYMPEAVKVIAKNNSPAIITNKEVSALLAEQAGLKSEVLRTGQEKTIGNITIKAVKAVHGIVPEMKTIPKYTSGFVIRSDKISVYHCGDTLYFWPHPSADIVLVPICGHIVMGPKSARKFLEEISPRLAIPMHYDSPHHPKGTDAFVKAMEGSKVDYKILGEGESLDIAE